MADDNPMTHGDEFILVTGGQDIYAFDDEQTVIDFLNEKGVKDQDDRNHWEVLQKFPMPKVYGAGPGPAWISPSPSDDDDDEDEDEEWWGEKHTWCPFGRTGPWTENCVLILKNGTVYVPKRQMVKKMVEQVEWVAPPSPPPPVKKAPAKIAPRKKARRKK